MLRIFGRGTRLCDGITRREVLRVGALAFGGLSLADLLRLRADAASSTLRAKSVIMVWLRGGPSHIDSYDMKPDAPGRNSRRVSADFDKSAGHPDLRAYAAAGRDHGQAGDHSRDPIERRGRSHAALHHHGFRRPRNAAGVRVDCQPSQSRVTARCRRM